MLQKIFLLTTGRHESLVQLELESWLQKVGVSLVEIRPLESTKSSGSKKRNDVLLEAVLDIDEGDLNSTRIDIVIGNCALIRNCYDEILAVETDLAKLVEHVHAQPVHCTDVFLIGRKKNQKDDILEQLNKKEEESSKATNDKYHLLSDLRSSMQQSTDPYYCMKLFATGGDSGFKRSSNKQENVTNASSSHNTTRLDSLRCHLLCSSAGLKRGMLIMDPFAGSGATLEIATKFYQTIPLASDVDKTCMHLAQTSFRQKTGLHGNCTISDIRYTCWRTDSVDAIICDPPYNIRTSKLSETNATEENILGYLFGLANTILIQGGKLSFWWWCVNSEEGIDNTVIEIRKLLASVSPNLLFSSFAIDNLGLGSSNKTQQSLSWIRMLIVITNGIVECDEDVLPVLFVEKDIDRFENNRDIFKAAWTGNLKAMIKIHKLDNEALKKRDKKGVTPLMFACGFGRIECARYMLEDLIIQDQLDLDLQCSKGSTALIRAARFGANDIANLLIFYGANFSVVDESGLSALDHAVAFNHILVVESLLSAHMEQSIDLFHENETGKLSLFHIASQWNSCESLILLIEYYNKNSDGDKKQNFKMQDGTTPLHISCRYGHEKVTLELLRNEVFFGSLHDKDDEGQTPIDLSLLWNRSKTFIDMLSSHIG